MANTIEQPTPEVDPIKEQIADILKLTKEGTASGLEAMKPAVVDTASAIKAGGLKTVAFIEQQAPEMVQQLIYRKLAQEFGLVLCLMPFCVYFLSAIKKLNKAWDKEAAEYNAAHPDSNRSYDGTGYFFLIIMCAIAACTTGIISVISLYDGIVVYVAPKLYVLEYLVNLFK